MKKYCLLFTFLTLSLTSIHSQCFDPGTGADGVYHATSNTTLAGATYNFSSFTIDPGVTVTVTGTQPLIVQCTGAVNINGILTATGENGANGVTYSNGGVGGLGVAGGANGGDGSFSSPSGPIVGTTGSGAGGANTQGAGWSGGGGAGYAAIGQSSGGVGGFGGPIYGDINITDRKSTR